MWAKYNMANPFLQKFDYKKRAANAALKD